MDTDEAREIIVENIQVINSNYNDHVISLFEELNKELHVQVESTYVLDTDFTLVTICQSDKICITDADKLYLRDLFKNGGWTCVYIRFEVIKEQQLNCYQRITVKVRLG